MLLLCVWAATAAASEVPVETADSEIPRPESSTEINKQLTNPVTTTWSLKTESTVSFLSRQGASNCVEYTLKFQPTLPIVLTPRWKVITRPEFTLVEDKPFTDAGGAAARVTGVGDTILDIVVAPIDPHWLFGVGPTFIFPTASTEQTGQGNWQVGPAGVGGYLSKQWLAGLIAQQWWSFAGSASHPADSELHLQYLASWFFPHGWSVGTSPTIRFDWRTTPGDKVTFPLGLFVAKVVKLGGRLPVKFELEGLYAPVHPASYGEQFAIKLYITPVIPAFVQGPVLGP